MKYLHIYESHNIETKILDREEFRKEIYRNGLPKDNIFDRIPYLHYTDFKGFDNIKAKFFILKKSGKIIAVSKIGNFTKQENLYSIVYFSIDKDYRNMGYSHALMKLLFKYAKENNLTLKASIYSYVGDKMLRKLLHKYSKEYKVEFIDNKELLDNENFYIYKGGKYFKKDEIENGWD